MVERNSQIDIVIPFYNDSDKKWRKIVDEYLKKENSTDRQVIGEERYRDWENFRYWFRAVEKNCKWVNKIFLVVASESQIPFWLDRDNPKLRIVYHEDFIPKELLPTFNTMTIELYFSKIKDLSDNYIYCNDDYFFLNPTTEDMFFRNNLPVYKDTESEIKKLDTSGVDGTFYSILNNVIDFQLRTLGDKAKWYSIEHLPAPHKKNFESKLIDKHYEELLEANSSSHFRHKTNYSNHIFNCTYKDTRKYYKYDVYKNSCYMSITKDTDFNDYKDYDMVCFNDTQLLNQDDFIETKNKMLKFLINKFPKKSLFEKEGGIKMVKLEALEDFTLGRFSELKNIVRKDTSKNEDGWVYSGDVFECSEDLYNYLTGANKYGRTFVNVIEVIPEKKEEPKEEPVEVEEKVEKPISKKKPIIKKSKK